MKLTFAVGVCTESRELESLLYFLEKVCDPEDEINVLVDTTKATDEVSRVLASFKRVTTCFRPFDGDFSAHRNYHIEQCTGDYIFMIDADEIPQESLVRGIKGVIESTGAELVYVPRMNLCPGYTESWARGHKFNINEVGWINWPDFQGRVFKRDPPRIVWGNKLHEKVVGSTKTIGLEANPKNGLWHVKTVLKQDAQGRFYETIKDEHQ